MTQTALQSLVTIPVSYTHLDVKIKEISEVYNSDDKDNAKYIEKFAREEFDYLLHIDIVQMSFRLSLLHRLRSEVLHQSVHFVSVYIVTARLHVLEIIGFQIFQSLHNRRRIFSL